MVAARAIHRTAHWIDHHPPRHCFAFDAGMHLQFRVERLFGTAVEHQLDAVKQPAPADVTDIRMIAETLAQSARQVGTLLAHVGEQIGAMDDLLHRQRCRASERMSHIGVAVLKGAGAVCNRREDLLADQQRTDGRETATHALGDRQQIWAYPFLLAGVQGARSAHSAHHFVENEQDAVAVADFSPALEIARHRRDRAHGRADDGLRDEGDDVVSTDFADFAFELPRQALPILVRAFVRTALAILVDWRDVMRLDQQRREWLALPFAAADGERAERYAVIALAPSDDVPALHLTALDEKLARQLQRRLDRLGTATDEHYVVDAVRSVRDEFVGEFFGHPRGKETGVRVFETVQLSADRLIHSRMRMAEAGHGSSAGRVDVVLAICVTDENSSPARCDGIV